MKLLILIYILTINSLNAQVNQEWVAKYKDSATGTVYPVSISTDNSGNSYVTGNCNTVTRSRIITFKYSSQGILQWHIIYQSGGIEDIALKNIVDKENNIYVVGYSNYSPNNDVVILKYNPNGDSIWVKRYTGLSLIPRDIVIDKYSNIYITSMTEFIGVNYFTMEYDSSGNFKWGSMYNFGDIPESIALDSMQNVLVTGNGVGTGFYFNYITVKYDNDGNLKWARNYASPGDAEGKSIGADKNGNVFVTGYITQSNGNTDYSTLKYDSTGNLLWNRDFDREVSKGPLKLLIDSSENCFVVGSSSILKYNSLGNLLWLDTSTFYPGRHCKLDNTGNLYITKPLSENTLSYINTRKYGNNGNKLWEINYGGNVNFSYEPFGLALDYNKNVFVTGIKIGFTSDTLFTLKYSQITGILNQNELVKKDFKLFQNYPNPFNPKTVISYQLSVNSLISIKVYNILGNEIKSLVNKKVPSGNYKIEFDGINLSNGIYFYTLFINNVLLETKKMILIK